MAGELTTQADVQLDRIERLIRDLRAEVTQLSERLDKHIAADEARTKLVDQFIDPALNLDGSLQQIGEIGRTNSSAIDRQTVEIRELSTRVREMDGAVRLFVSYDQVKEAVT